MHSKEFCHKNNGPVKFFYKVSKIVIVPIKKVTFFLKIVSVANKLFLYKSFFSHNIML